MEHDQSPGHHGEESPRDIDLQASFTISATPNVVREIKIESLKTISLAELTAIWKVQDLTSKILISTESPLYELALF